MCGVHTQTKMKDITVVVVLVILLLAIVHLGYCQEAVLTPSEYVAYEGQPEVTFQCTATLPGLQVLFVLVDGLQLNIGLNERGITATQHVQLGDTTSYQQNITIAATQRNEDTTIQCYGVVISEGTHTSTTIAEATFKVQGLPAPVTDLTSEYYNDYNQILTWTPPFTLDITDVDPDITYRVCNNVTERCMDTPNATYIFPTTCFPVEYRVSACNPVGCSENATIEIDFKFVQEPTEIAMVSTEFLYMEPSVPIVLFIFVSDGNCTGLYQANFTGTFNRTNKISPPPLIPTVDENGTVIITCTEEDGVVPNERFTGEIGSDQMTPNGTDMMMDTNFTTFDVQETDVTPEGGSITVTCTFARGSEALGSRVFVLGLSSSDAHTCNKDALREDNTSPTSTVTFTGLQNGTYIVYIVDIEADGTIRLVPFGDENGPFSRFVTITDAPAPTPSSPTPAPSSPTVPSASPTVPTTGSSQSDSPSGIIAGVVVAVVIAVAVAVAPIVVAYCMWKKKKGKRSGALCSCGKSSEESVRLSRIASDGGTPVVHLPRIASDGGTPVPRPPPYQDMDVGLPPPVYTVEEQLVGPTYAELGPGVSRTSHGVLPSSNPPTFYSELQQRSLQADPNLKYAELGSRPTTIPQNAPIKEGETKYAEILPHARPTTQPATQTAPLTSATVADHEMNVENLSAILYECQSKWQVIGEVFGISEDLLDEIFTNNDSTYDCLIQMVIWYLRRAETTPTWGDIAKALETEAVGETRLADLVRKKYATEINLPGMVSSPSQEEHGHFGFPVQETKSAPGEVVYPSMPGEEPPPPPPPRISEDEDAPPLPPRMGSAQDMFDTADFRDTLQPSQCTEEGGSLPSSMCVGGFLGISGPCFLPLSKPEPDSEPDESFGDLSPPSQQEEDTALTLKGQTIFPKLKTRKSAFTAKRLSTVVYSVPSKPGNETSEEHPAEESTEVAGITEIGDGGRIRCNYFLPEAVKTLQKAAYGVRNCMAMITECILHVSPKWKAISAEINLLAEGLPETPNQMEAQLAEGLPEAPNNRMVSLGWIKEESLMRSLLAHIPTATLDVTIQSGAWRWSIAIAMRDKAVIFSSTLLNFVHM